MLTSRAKPLGSRSTRLLAMSLSSLARATGSAVVKSSREVVVETKKYGPSSRHANSGMTVTVFGAYGSTGRYIVNELGEFSLR